MRADELKQKLTEELSDMAPNRLDDLLRACEESERTPRPVEVQPRPAETRRPRRRMPQILATAAAFVLLIGGILGYRAIDASRCVLTFDVNPSVSLTVNGFNRVKEVTPLNADAQALLEHVDLQGMPLGKTVRTLTAALIDENYLSDRQNAMLVSVENATDGRAEALNEKVASAVADTAKAHLFRAAVLCQRISGETDIRTEAETWNVSAGKAALVAAMSAQIEDCPAERLSTLSIQDLLFLVDARDVTLENVSLFGTVNSLGYHDSAAAAAIALKNAGLSGSSESDVMVSIDSRDGALVYIVGFSNGTYAYRYAISAASGAILDVMQTAETAQPSPEETQGLIDPMDALKHVLAFVHYTVEEIQNLNIQTEWVENTPFYRISFEVGGQEHHFYVNARTDDIF